MYEQVETEQLILRDRLALDRTDLANERTLLAYLRTALMSLISGVTLIKLFADSPATVVFGYLLLPLSLLVGAWGVARFLRMRRRIRSAGTPQDLLSARRGQ